MITCRFSNIETIDNLYEGFKSFCIQVQDNYPLIKFEVQKLYRRATRIRLSILDQLAEEITRLTNQQTFVGLINYIPTLLVYKKTGFYHEDDAFPGYVAEPYPYTKAIFTFLKITQDMDLSYSLDMALKWGIREKDLDQFIVFSRLG